MVTVAEHVRREQEQSFIRTGEHEGSWLFFRDFIKNPAASTEFLKHVALKFAMNSQVAEILVSHVNTSEEIIRHVIEANTFYVYLNKRVDVNPYALEYAYEYSKTLSDGEDVFIMNPPIMRVAKHQNTPGHVLEELWSRWSNSKELEEILIMHQNLPLSVAQSIYASNTTYFVRVNARDRLREFFLDYPDEWFEEIYPV